jgi:hypothetical protein
MARDRNDKSTIAFFERLDLGQKLEPDWNIPSEYPDLTKYPQIAIDLETCDPHLTTLGPGWARKTGSSWVSRWRLETKLGTSRSATRTDTTLIRR